MMNKRDMNKVMKEKAGQKMGKDVKEHHSGKGTKARVNTMAEKYLFNTRSSK